MSKEPTLVTHAQLENGDIIKHPMWGPLKFTHRVGKRHYFRSEEHGPIDLIDFGHKFRLTYKASGK